MAKLITEELNKTSDIKIDMCLNSKMANAIELWSMMYRNESPWVNNKTIFSANLPASIASEVARLVTLELKSEVAGSSRANYINGVYGNILANLRQYTEYGCAKGGLIFKPYVTSNGIQVQYIQADCFFPISFDTSGNITHCAFVEQIRRGTKIYTRLEIHQLNGSQLKITNRAFLSTTDAVLGSEISIADVPQWSELQYEVVYDGVKKLPFGYFKVPLANTVDDSSPLGVSVFSRAVSLIKEADRRYSNISWEYEAKEAAVHIGTSMLKMDKESNKFEYPGGKERLYRVLEYENGATDKPLLDVFSPEIRDTSLFNGFNNQLKLIEFNCSLAYGTISDPQLIEKTAEEIKTSKQRSYTMISDTQMALQNALEDLIAAIDFWATIYNLAPMGTYETSYTWDDSIVVDAEKERKQDMVDMAAGIMRPDEYRAKWYGETKEEALNNLPPPAVKDVMI
jgi:A118 family predicted phage portal protein